MAAAHDEAAAALAMAADVEAEGSLSDGEHEGGEREREARGEYGECALGPTVFASNQLNTPACSFFKQTMSILLKTTRYMTFLRDLEVPDLIF